MKKISTLIALATLVTVGSVYASWQYTTGTLKTDFFLDGTTNVGITDKVGAKKGALTIDREAFSVVIDDTNNDHHADFSVNGQLTITWKPANYGALTAEEKANGLKLYFKLDSTISDYKNVKVFALCADAHAIAAPQKNGEGEETTFTYTITAAEIDKALSFYTNTFSDNEDTDDGDLFLDTEPEYDAFKENLHNGALKITIGEASDFTALELE